MVNMRLFSAPRLCLLTLAVLVSWVQAMRNPVGAQTSKLFVSNASANGTHHASNTTQRNSSLATAFVSLGTMHETKKESRIRNIVVVLAVAFAFMLGAMFMYNPQQQQQQEQEQKEQEQKEQQQQEHEHGHEQEHKAEDAGSHVDTDTDDGDGLTETDTEEVVVTRKARSG
eukprot:TRINITY_DN2402_c0_g2_i1.p1 TRINITY_DN2402_c0_g2~~TRINITY_DN2402_c0_g2_i1.p1  ORF type:complete len:171 (-),score=37.58 TRINITY_DN2402_c0_g2_i1:271-783(-)